MTPAQSTHNTPLLLAAFAGLALAMGLAASASADDDGGLADLLEEKGYISPEERESIRAPGAETTDEATPAVSAASEEEKKDEPAPPKISIDHKGLAVTSGDGKFKAAFGGRLQFDAGGFIEDLNELGAGAEIRRGRIKSYGHVYYDWKYKLEVNFDPDLSVPITDGWLKYDGDLLPFSVTVGNQKVPFSQQSMTSSNWQVFQERSLQDAFIDNPEVGRRRLGMVLGKAGESWNVQYGAFAEGVSTAGSGDEDFGTAARAVWAPLNDNGRLLTIDGAVYYRLYSQTGAADELRFQARPESHIAGVSLVDTGVLATAKDNLLVNVGVSGGFGPVHVQGEYTGLRITRRGQQNVYLQGYYLQAGWFITGENRVYDIKSGKYKRPKPDRTPLGAWELAVRWSHIDMQDRDVVGGEENNFSTGLNWWANRNVMFRFNYIYGMLRPNSDAQIDGDPILAVPGVDENIHAFLGRAQIVF